MMTTLSQLCTSVADPDGNIKFRIQSSVSHLLAGDLPFVEIFVYSAPVYTDPKQDVFQRIATIIDLTSLIRGRDSAFKANQSTYLAASFTVDYDDVSTATAAKGVIQARVNQLISDWSTYQTAFIIPNAIPLPLIDSSIVIAAKAAFAAAKTKRDAATAASAAATAAVLTAQSADGVAITALTSAVVASNLCAQIKGTYDIGIAAQNTFASQVATFIADAQAFLTACSVFDGQHAGGPPTWTVSDANKVTWDAALSILLAEITSFMAQASAAVQANVTVGAANAQQTTDCGNKLSAIAPLATAKTAADVAFAQAQTAAAVAEAAAVAASTAYDKALAAAVAVCPGFDPNA